MGEFSYGNMLREVRESWRFTQEHLAERMEPHVSDKRGARRKDAIRTAISQMETGARDFRPEMKTAAALALDIPEKWFYYPMPSMAALRKSLAKLRAQQNSGRRISLSSVAKDLPRPQQPSSLPVPNEFFKEPSRDELLKGAFRLIAAPGPALIVIEGLSGYGKSSFASLLVAKAIKSEARSKLVIAVSCRNRSTEQIETAIKDAIGQIDGRLRDRPWKDVLSSIPTILVLDDFYQLTKSQSAPAMAGELTSRLSTALEKGGGLKLVVTGGNGSGQQKLLESLKKLVGETRYMRVLIGELPPTDVLWFLTKGLKLEAINAKKLARGLGGDPIRIGTFVSAQKVGPIGPPELNAMSRRLDEDQEQPGATGTAEPESDDGSEEDPRSRELEALVEQFLDLGTTTFLTAAVLALSPNGSSIENTVKLVRALISEDGLSVGPAGADEQIKDVRTALSKPLHPFINLDAHTVELHARVKATVARSVPKVLGLEGARTMHRRLAEAALSRLPSSFSKSFVPTTANLADFQAMLQHVMDLYKLAPIEASISHGRLQLRPESPFDPDSFVELLADANAIRSRYSIANTAFDALMLSRVGTENDERMLTRQFGDFEQKLSLLSRFLVDRDMSDPDHIDPIPELRPEFASHVLLDVAVCANQAGLIDVAHGAIRRRQSFRTTESTGALYDKVLDILGSPSGIEHPNMSSLATSLEADSENINVYVSVLLREGELENARTFVDRYADKASAVLQALETHRAAYNALTRKHRRHINSLLLSCRRLLSKRGQVLVMQGQFDTALAEFRSALHADEFRRGGATDGTLFLSGETGRSYCIALAAVGGKANLDSAACCVEQNIDKARSSLRTYDMLDWYTLQGSIHRLRGDYESATRSLSSAEQIRREDGVALSFVSSVTLTIEQERLKLRKSAPKFNTSRLITVQDVAASSKHKLLACDATLLLAEASTGRERTLYLMAARSAIKAGYGFRRNDAETLDAGRTCEKLV